MSARMDEGAEGVRSEEEIQARIELYNAVTRARRWCHIIVQGQDILAAPPFA